jgi:hypothetical protein
MTGHYAKHTKVAPEKSEAEIKALLRKRGATSVWSGADDKHAQVGFVLRDRHVRFTLHFPPVPNGRFDTARNRAAARDQEIRRLWRALLLSIKAKLELVDSGIESYEVAFLAHFVTPDGRTVADLALPALDAMYASGAMPSTFLGLPAPPSPPTAEDDA